MALQKRWSVMRGKINKDFVTTGHGNGPYFTNLVRLKPAFVEGIHFMF